MEVIKKRKATILIVDDMVANIALLSDLLKDDYDVKIAKSGAKAIEIAGGYEKPDLILLDVVMPEMDGYEVCKILKSNASTHDIPIIFVTGNDSDIDEERGLNLGAVDYIKKPFNPSIAKIRVRNHINLKLKSDMLEELSMCDALTHIPNRRNFNERFEVKYKESLRDKMSFGVMMIDVDFFKLYNDNYGHGRGDSALIKVAHTLQKNLKRPFEMVARYGGEEFVVILKDIDKDGLKKVAESLLDSIQELKIPHEYSAASSYISISIGISFKDVTEEKSKDQLLEESDSALYEAKTTGRNKYVIVA
ncbi:MAG: diguanylate cyclase [Sulfurimonas sp.]|nr:diguanylate cyclase [Sulfurimonas sp.]